MKNASLKSAILMGCLSVVFCSASFGSDTSETDNSGAASTLATQAGGEGADRSAAFGSTENIPDCQILTNVYFFPVLDRFGNAAQPGCFYRNEDYSLNKDCRPDNGFGKDARSLPTDWRRLIDSGVTLHACTWNIPLQDWNSGSVFPDAATFYGVRKRNEWFALRYRGEFEVTRRGAYEFRMTSDDGSKLIIDDHLVIDNDGFHTMQEGMGLIDLDAGMHKLDLQYFQGPRTHLGLTVEVRRPGNETFELFDASLPR